VALTVVGSIAFDSVRTPFGERERMLGGSASHFALAASFFTDVRVVGPVGDDFGADEIGVLQSHGISTTDVEHVEGGRTFFWRGHYDHDMNIAHTDETQLNVFADFVPKLCEENRSAEMLFLGNIQPELQRQVREEADGARFVALDSMNLWIETARDPLLRVIGMIDCVLLNDAELRMLTGESNLVVASHRIMEHGPTIVVVKRGEYGAALFTGDDTFTYAIADGHGGTAIGTVTIHAIDVDENHKVVCYRPRKQAFYWLWRDGMSRPERRAAEIA